jgi:hypothetical protein
MGKGFHVPTDTETVMLSVLFVLIAIERTIDLRQRVVARRRGDELIPLIAGEKQRSAELKPGSFYLLVKKFFTWDRFYKVFVDQNGMHGAYLIGQIYDQASAATLANAIHQGAAGSVPHFSSVLSRRDQREQEYDPLLPGSPEFLVRDRKNFSIAKEEITRIIYNPRRSMMTEAVTNQGTLIVYTRSGRHRFIITGEQNVVAIVVLLEKFLPTVEFV